MATEVETLVVKLEGRITDFEKAMDKAVRSAHAASGKINRSFLDMNKSLGSVFRGAGALVGITALASIPKVVKDIVDNASNLVDTADKLGITTKALQELKFAAGQTGVEFGDLSTGLSFFAKQVGEAARGQGELLAILKANNVPLRDAKGNLRPLMDLFGDYADLVANAGDEASKTTLVTKALGRSNDELINTLSGGSAGLREFAEEANRTGQVLDDGLLRKTEELGDRWDKLMGTLTTGFQAFVLSLVTGVDDGVRALGQLLDAQVKAAAAPPAQVAAVQAEQDAERAAQDQAMRLSAIEQTQIEINGLEEDRLALIKRIEELQAKGGDSELLANLNEQLVGNLEQVAALQRGMERIAGAAANVAAGLTPLGQVPTAAPAAGEAPLPGVAANAFVGPVQPVKPRTTVIPGSGGGTNPQDAIDRVTKALAFEAEQLIRTTREQEIYNALNQAGVDITTAAGAAIAAQAGSNFDLKASITANIEAMDEFRTVAGDALRGFVNDLRDGRSASEALGNALNKLIDKILDAGIERLLNSLLGASGGLGGGLLGGLVQGLAGLFGGFRAEGGSVSAGRAYVVGEKRPELFVPNVGGRIMPRTTGDAVRHLVELVLTPEMDARIKKVSAPQSQQIALNITRTNNAMQQRQQELRG